MSWGHFILNFIQPSSEGAIGIYYYRYNPHVSYKLFEYWNSYYNAWIQSCYESYAELSEKNSGKYKIEFIGDEKEYKKHRMVEELLK